MDRFAISFITSKEESERAWLNFAGSTKFGMLFRRLSFPVVSAAIFVAFLVQSDPSILSPAVANAKTETILGVLIYSSVLLLCSLLIGWFLVGLLRTIRKNAIIEGLRDLHRESFGEVFITLEPTGVAVKAPLFDGHYRWKMLDSVLMTSEFLFICSGQGYKQSLVFWIPRSALGSDAQAIAKRVNEWLEGSEKMAYPNPSQHNTA